MQESTYDRPAFFQTKVNAFAGINNNVDLSEDVGLTAAMLTARRKGKAGAGQKPFEKTEGGWEKFQDGESGYWYYYNSIIDISTYDRPENFQTNMNPFGNIKSNAKIPASVLTARRDANEKPVSVLNNGFVKYYDEETGYHYYYNETIDESTYDRPENFSTNANPFGKKQNTPAVPASVLTARRDAGEKPTEVLNNGFVKVSERSAGGVEEDEHNRDESTPAKWQQI